MKSQERLYIIFGGEHYNPLGMIRSLGEAGINPIAIIKKAQFMFASKSKYISKLHLVDTIEEGYQLLIKEYSHEKLKPFLFTSDDQVTSFLDNHCDELKNHFIFYNANLENGRISKFMNKDTINKLAIKYGLKVAKNWKVKTGEIPKDIKFPVLTKANYSLLDNWKEDSFICKNEAELKEAFKHIRSKEILIQEFIKKKNELALDGFCVEKGKKVFYAIATNNMDLIEGGYCSYLLVKNTYEHELEKKLNKMFKEIGFEGIFEAEFLVGCDDEYYFLEINFRQSAFNYASTVAGMNLPLLWSEAMEDSSIIDRSYKEFRPFYAMAEFVDFNERVKSNKVSFLTWLNQFRKCKCHFFINRHDMRPIYSKITNKFRKVFKRGIC